MNRTKFAIAMILILSAITLSFHVSTTTLEFSRYNWQWTGTSGFFDRLEAVDAVEIHDFSTLSGRDDSLLLLIASDALFSSEETAYLKDFLAEGNTILIADETGSANQLLQDLGSEMRIISGNLSSIDMEFSDPGSVIAFVHSEDLLLSGVSAITTNRPAAVSGGDSLLAASLFSWMDANGNGHPDPDEPVSQHTILSREPLNGGTIYVLSDPSIFINGMLDIRTDKDNRQFITNILSSSNTVLIEQTHSLTASTDGVLEYWLRAKNTMIIKIIVLIGFISAVIVGFYRKIM
jgi:hypothetical protein